MRLTATHHRITACLFVFAFLGAGKALAGFTTNTFGFAYTNREALLADGWDFIARQPSWVVSGAMGFVDRNTETTNGLVVDYDQSAHPGALRIPVDEGDLWYNNNNSRNTLFRNLSNDWVSLRAQMSFRPTQTYQTASLLLYQDDDNFVAMVHDYNDSERAGFGFENDAFGLILASANIAATNIWLRLDRDLDTGNVSGFYSLEGTNWTLVGQVHQSLLSPRLAIFVGGGESGGSGQVDLSRVDIITSATNPAPVLRLSPQHLVFNAVAGQACTNLQRVNLVVRSQDDPVHWSTTNTAPWLSSDPGAGDTPGFCNVAVDAAGLAAGTYEGAVQFGAPGAVSAAVNVTLIVNPASRVQVATWGGGKGGAMSVSVDDSYPTAFDDLATNGFAGTYFENGNLAPAFYSSYYQAGMELGSHTLNHPCFILNELAWRYELERNLAGLCPGSLPCESVITFAYPCGEHDILEEFVTADYFLAARGYNINQLEDATPNDYMNLKSFNSRDDPVLLPPVNNLTAMVDAAIEQGKWFNLVLHALNVDDGAIAYSVGRDIWVAPIGTITKYILQRDRTVITNYYAVAGQISFDCYRLPLDASSRRSFETAIGLQDTLTMQVDLTGMNAVSGLTVNGTPAPYSFKAIGGKERMLFNLSVTGTPQTVVVQCTQNNTGPVLGAQTNRTISALSTLAVANTASDPDAPPQTLTYTLLNPPAGAQIDANGVIQWTPSTNQIPGPYTLTTVVTDSAQPPLSATNTFGVVVEPPGYFLLPAISDVTLNEGQNLAITNTAISTGVPNPEVATNSIYFFYTNRDALLADGWSFIATNWDGSPRDTEVTDPAVGALVSYDQTAHPGVLRIPCDEGDLYGWFTIGTRNSLFRTLATNWTSMKLWVSFAPTQDYQQTHIGIYQDDNNYLDIGLAHNTVLGGEVTTYVLETNGVPNHYYMGASFVTNIVLRMDQNAANGTVDGLYSVDGTHWTFMGTWPQPFTNPRLTVWTSSSFLPYTAGSPNADMQQVDVVTSNLVVQVLTYRLIDAPAGATISTNGVITWTPTAGQAGQTFVITTVATDNSVPPLSATNSFSVRVRGVVAITGTVAYYPTNYPSSSLSGKRVGSVTMSVTGDTNLSGFTLPDGSYSLTNIPVGGTCCVTPSKTDDSPTANGVDSYDQYLIQRHVLRRTLLNSPFKLLAADVDGSGGIDSYDQYLIQRLILNRTTQFPAGLWRYVPTNYLFLDPQNPWNAPSNRWYTNLVVDVSDGDFVAIKLGDVDDSWTASSGGQSVLAKSVNGSKALAKDAAPEVVFAVSQQSAQRGQEVTVGVTVSGFHQVTSAQSSLAWDPVVLRYLGTGSYGLRALGAGSFGTTLAENGKLAFAWYDPQVDGVTLADGTVIFTVSFEVIGQAGSVSAVALAGAPTAQGVSVDGGRVAFGAQEGSVAVVGPGVLVSKAGYANGVFRLSVPTEKGRSYILEFSDALAPANWTAMPAVLGNGTVNVLVDPVATNQQRFYRVRVQ